MGYKSLKAEYLSNMHIFCTKCSPDVEIPPVLLSVFTVSESNVTKGGNVRSFHKAYWMYTELKMKN